jgi:hypothetical protein
LQRVPAAAGSRSHWRPTSSSPSHQFRGARRRDGRRSPTPGRQPARHPDWRGRRWKDAHGCAQIAAAVADQYRGGAWYVDLATITDPALVPVAAARALGLPDQPGRSSVDTIVRFIADRRMLVVLDNCEHLLDASAALIAALLGGCAEPARTGLTSTAAARHA